MALQVTTVRDAPGPREESHAIPEVRHLVYVVDGEHRQSGQVLVVHAVTRAVLQTIPTGYYPQIALSAEGDRLFLADGFLGRLSAIDTATGQVVRTALLPDMRCQSTIFGDHHHMQTSPDGRGVLLCKWAYYTDSRFRGQPRSERWWLAVDGDTLEPQPATPRLENCSGNTRLLALIGGDLAALCGLRQELLFLDAASGAVAASVPIQVPASSGAAGSLRDAHPGGAVADPRRPLIYVPIGGWLLVVNGKQKAVERWIDLALRQGAGTALNLLELSPDGSRLFLGITGKGPRGWEAKELWALDTGSWQRLWRVPLDAFYFDLALSPGGTVLYLVAPDERRLAALDASTGSELWRMEGLGESPGVVKAARLLPDDEPPVSCPVTPRIDLHDTIRAASGGHPLWLLGGGAVARWTPNSPEGMVAKTAWVVAKDYPPRDLVVTGRRLDGPGAMTFWETDRDNRPGAPTDTWVVPASILHEGFMSYETQDAYGTFRGHYRAYPSPGCWEITARLGENELRIMQWLYE